MGFFSKDKEVEEKKEPDTDRIEKEKRIMVNDKVDEGYIHTKLIIEMVGAPKDHFQTVINSLIEKITAEFDLVSHEVEDLEEKDGLYHTFIETELLFKDMEVLFQFCFDYMPSNVEILAPSKFILDSPRFSNIANDLLAKIHHMDDVLKHMQADNQLLKKSSTTLFKNMVLVALAPGPKGIEDLVKLTGIKKEQLEPLLEKMIGEKLIKKEGTIYSFIKR